jgi:uncharacterized damage-inducible protein DinB
MQPDQAHFLLHEVYLPRLKHEHRVTRTLIEAVPLDKGDYRPDSIAKSAFELASHIASAEIMFLDAVASGEFHLPPAPLPETVRNSHQVAAWYGENFAKQVERLEKMSNDQLVKMVDFRGVLQQPAVLYLALASHHSVHHRGQLSVYLRPMGAKVPAIYGESYDSRMAAQAQKA